jgi:UDP-N-acetylglucosamine--N-acetylmuramyl-(pentapeptide) pyrophosphoryl-undecaprenol N-acetylglucosamine transferase
MKILLTGGGTGGHFYPIVAVAEAIREKSREDKLIDPELYYMAPEPYDNRKLLEQDIIFKRISAGKIRRYFSIMNFIDLFKTGWGVIKATIEVFKIFPDVVFGKGGYVSFPALLAAKFFKIPVVIHESDSVPGKLNIWAGKFAKKVAVSYPEAGKYFPPEKVAYTGNPVRNEIKIPQSNGAHEYLHLEQNVPVIVILGGSQGSMLINDILIDSLNDLLHKYQIIHQTGKNNFEDVKNTTEVVLGNHPYKYRYHPHDYLNDLSLRMCGGIADIIISRAGSTIFEIANWGVPSILIPITDSNGDHQRQNAFNYARTGAGVVIEEKNLTSHIFISEITRIVENQEEKDKMRQKALSFIDGDASKKIARVILEIALEHEK